MRGCSKTEAEGYRTDYDSGQLRVSGLPRQTLLLFWFALPIPIFSRLCSPRDI